MMKKWTDKKWIIAVSGGPDSMALFQLCLDEKVDVVCAHVNYKKRDTADRDEDGVIAFCKDNQIPIEISYPIQEESGNFQGWARKVRYQFFKECAEKYNASGVLVAHHEDDVLETFLLQKKRRAIPRQYGLSDESMVERVLVYRPLLLWTKEKCIAYCKEEKVSYYIDESNLEDDYQRNKIRHEIVEKLSVTERKELLQEMQEWNDKLNKSREAVSNYRQSRLNLEEFNKESEDKRNDILRQWLSYHCIEEEFFSERYFNSLNKMLKSERNFKVPLKNHWLVKQGKICEIVGKEDKEYHVVLQSYRSVKNEHFEITDQGPMICGVTVQPEDYPLIIRSPKPGDAIQLRLGTKKVHRWFIDRKIPLIERECWPIVENSKGEVILVPGIGCDVKHYTVKPNLFVVK